MRKWNRRELLRDFGSCSFLFMPILSERLAFGAEPPKKRLLVSLTSSGVVQEFFWPKGTPDAYSVDGTTLAPLKKHLSQLNIIKGLTNDWGAYDSHSGGAVSLLTGDYLNSANCNRGSCDYPSGRNYAQRASIDQILAKRIGNQTPVPSLNLGILLKDQRPSKYVAYSENGQYVDQYADPYEAFDTLFKPLFTNCSGSSQTGDAQMAALRLRRKSVLDAINADIVDTSRRLGLNGIEKAKLDSYAEGLRQIERGLEGIAMEPKGLDVCSVLPSFRSGERVKIEDAEYPKVARLQMELIVAAFQLDLTRIATLVWSVGGTGGVPASWLDFQGQPIREAHHPLTHGQVDPVNWYPKLRIIDNYHASEFSWLLGRLQSVPEGNSTLLDNSLAMWTSEVGEGSTHSRQNIPFVIAGSAGGAFPTGKYIAGNGQSHTNLLLSILHAMGSKDIASVGKQGLCTGPLIPIA